MHILFANLTLAGRTGTEVVLRDLAVGMARRGHRASVFAPALGPLADEMSTAGIAVTDDLSTLTDAPAVIHGQHFLQTMKAVLRFPSARAVFVCHDRHHVHAMAPRHPRVRRFVAVDHNCLERLRDDGRIPAPDIRVILNAVDLARFQVRDPLPPAPARALIFSHYASEHTHVRAVREACAVLGIPVDVAGAGSGRVSEAPEILLRGYDLVFAKARCAIEAMAVGTAVVVCDAAGVGGMVTTASVQALRPWNFGARTLVEPLAVDTLVREVRRYDAGDAARVSQTVRGDASLGDALDRYEALYDEVLRESVQTADDDITEVLEPLLHRLAWLETQVAQHRRPFRMPALSNAATALVRLRTDTTRLALPVGGAASVPLSVENASTLALASAVPFPVHLGCLWRQADEAGFARDDAPRTVLTVPIEPGTSDVYRVQVRAPETPGRYVLRLTLVQEYLRWLDLSDPPIAVDIDVEVRDSSSTAATGSAQY